MIEFSIGFLISVFGAGVLMFLAPCTLPLVPAYIAFISGTQSAGRGGASLNSIDRNRIRINGTMFVIGFSLTFILFGILAGYFGSFIGPYRTLLSQAGGLLIIFFGLMMLGIFRMTPLEKDYRIPIPKSLTPGNPMSALLIGSAFAFGWTPCVGPVLASVFLLATTSTTLVQGAFLLSIFSLGMAIPFLLTAFFYSYAAKFIETYSWISRFVSIVGGVFLIGLGALLLLGDFGLTVEYGYRFFYYIGLDTLFNYY